MSVRLVKNLVSALAILGVVFGVLSVRYILTDRMMPFDSLPVMLVSLGTIAIAGFGVQVRRIK